MGLFRRLRRVTTGAVRQRVKNVFSRESTVVDDELDETPPAVRRPAPTPRVAAPAPGPAPAPAPSPAADDRGPSDSVQVVDGPSGRRSL